MATIGITYKTFNGEVFYRHPPPHFAARALSHDIQSIRLPVSHKSQKHLPGYFWMSRMESLVAYESRLEMTILLQLDFNKHVDQIISQPFLLHYSVKSSVFRHTPDFLVLYDNGAAQVINVKPKKFIDTKKNREAFEACKQAAIEMGWAYSTRCEMDEVLLANLRWLAGYRRSPIGLVEYGARIVEAAANPVSISFVTHFIGGLPALTRPVLFHLLWIGTLETSLYDRMTDKSTIWVSKKEKCDEPYI